MADKATVYIIEDDDAVRDSIHLLIGRPISSRAPLRLLAAFCARCLF